MNATLRNTLAYLFAASFLLTGKLKRVRKHVQNEKIILSICSHNPDKKLFEKCIKWLQKKGFVFISLHDLKAIANGEIPFPSGAVIITVDDGWQANQENVVAIANKYKIPVTLFITTDPVAVGAAYWWSYIKKAHHEGLIRHSVLALKNVTDDERLQVVESVKESITLKREALTLNALKEISKSSYISFGSHTVTHPILPNCSDKKSQFEISESRKTLEDWLKQKIVSFAYPNGDYALREIEYLKAAGYQMAFTSKETYITPENITNLFELPRIELVEASSFLENLCRITGIWLKERAQFKSYKIGQAQTASTSNNPVNRSITGTI